MGQRNRKPQPGDLIEIFRPGYQHWAIYVGDGYVIHVTDEGASSISPSSSSTQATKAKVKKQLLREAVKNDNWRVNNKYDRSHTPFPVKKIIQRAEQWIDREVTYNVLTSNCEHFVTMLRYGEALCEQVRKAVFGSAAAAVGLAAVAVAFPPFDVVFAAAAGVAAGSSAGGILLQMALPRGTFQRSYH